MYEINDDIVPTGKSPSVSKDIKAKTTDTSNIKLIEDVVRIIYYYIDGINKLLNEGYILHSFCNDVDGKSIVAILIKYRN